MSSWSGCSFSWAVSFSQVWTRWTTSPRVVEMTWSLYATSWCTWSMETSHSFSPTMALFWRAREVSSTKLSRSRNLLPRRSSSMEPLQRPCSSSLDTFSTWGLMRLQSTASSDLCWFRFCSIKTRFPTKFLTGVPYHIIPHRTTNSRCLTVATMRTKWTRWMSLRPTKTGIRKSRITMVIRWNPLLIN